MRERIATWMGGDADPRIATIRLVFAVALWVVFVAAALWLTPLQVVGVVGGVLVGLTLLFWPAAGLLVFLGLRVLFDLAWPIGALGIGLNVMELFSAAATLGAGVLFLLRFDRLQTSPLLPALAVYGLMLGVAIVREPGLGGVEVFAKLVSPFLVLALVGDVFHTKRSMLAVPAVIAVCGVVPVAYSVYCAATGQGFALFAGTDRLVGAYQNPTHHALTMALFAALGTFGMSLSKRWWLTALMAAYTVGALVGLYYSYTRAALVCYAAFALIYLVLERRWRLLGLAVAAGVAVVASSETIQGRFVALGEEALSEEGYEDPGQQLGSGRWQLWTVSFRWFMARPAYDWLLGAGIGMDTANPMGMNPHNDYLSLLYQAGPLAVAAYAWILWRSGRTAWEAREGPDRELAALGNAIVALLVAGALTNAMTNGFLVRTSPAWYLMAVAGLAFALPKAQPPALRPA